MLIYWLSKLQKHFIYCRKSAKIPQKNAVHVKLNKSIKIGAGKFVESDEAYDWVGSVMKLLTWITIILCLNAEVFLHILDL